jgi:hypothetical protein
MLRKPRRRSVAIGAVVAAVVIGAGTIAAIEGGLGKCVRWAVDDAHAVATGVGAPPPPPPPVPSATASSSRSRTRVGCGDQNSTPSPH